jgi:hypothetical protein
MIANAFCLSDLSVVKTVAEPQSDAEFQELHEKTERKVKELFKSLLFGMQDLYVPGLKKLEESLSEQRAFFQSENNKRISNELKRVYEQLLRDFETTFVANLQLPVSSTSLDNVYNTVSYNVTL